MNRRDFMKTTMLAGATAAAARPTNAAGRTFRCPRCQAPVVVPGSGPTDFAFGPTGGRAGDDGNPFDDAGAPTSRRPSTRMHRAAKVPATDGEEEPAAGFNPFDADGGDDEPATGVPPAKRRYRKDADYNPFGDAPVAEEPDPLGEGFEFGVEAPPAAPAGQFDFGPLDPRRERG